MQLSQIKLSNNQINFGMIYQPKSIKWNSYQKKVVSNIKKSLKQPQLELNKNSIEAYYESKGMDFEITPASVKSVYLVAHKRSNKIDSAGNIIHSNYAMIGEYNKNSSVKISDIELGLKQKEYPYLNGFYYLLAGLLMSLTLLIKPINSSSDNNQSPAEVVKSNTEINNKNQQENIFNKSEDIKELTTDSINVIN